MLILAQLRKYQVMGRLAALRLQILVVWAQHEQRGGVEVAAELREQRAAATDSCGVGAA